MMMTDQSQAAETSRYVRELTERYGHNEPYVVELKHLKSHHSNHPSLLDQLRGAVESGRVDDVGSRIGASKPPVAISALDVLLRIEAASAVWVSKALGLKLRDTVEGNIRLLGTHTKEDLIGRDIQSWWRWARVEATWDGRPRDLRDPCPYCGQRMLRVAWDVSSAWCRECGADWGAEDVGMLGAMLLQAQGESA
jgi:hypothetical protein